MARRSEEAEVRQQHVLSPTPGAPVEVGPRAEEQPPGLVERLLEGSAVGVVACDERGVVRFANGCAFQLLPRLRVGELLPRPDLTPHGPSRIEIETAGHALVAERQDLPGGWTAWHLRDVGEHRSRLDALLAERARSRFLATASRRLGLSLHPGRTARAVAELATGELADAVVVVLPVRAGEVEWFRRDRRGGASTGRVRARALPDPVAAALGGLAPGPEPLVLAQLGEVPWATDEGVESAAVRALPGNGKPAGALVLLRTADAGDEPDAALVEEFAQRAGIALAAAALYAQQTRTSAVLKRSLLEPDLPELPGMVFGACYRPAEEALLIGGDFYDVHATPGGGAMLLLGDVCGKGVDAAVGTGQLRQSVQALRRLERDPVRLLELLNDTMLESLPPDADPRFATVVLGTAAPLPGGGLRLQLAGGGHPPPLVVRAGGVEAVEIGGTLVGALPGARFRSSTVDLGPGEACVLYTDGVIEARGGPDGREEFGEERLARLLAGCHVLPAPGIAERVAQQATSWLGDGGHDDIAVLVVQAPLPVQTAAAPRHLHAVHSTPSEEESA